MASVQPVWPKAIVFSQNYWDLQGVEHCLLQLKGAAAVASHWGEYRSSELARFRHGFRPYHPIIFFVTLFVTLFVT